ncbi:MAG: tetratricopeptide repeat protein [Flavobacteriales bacterium]|jgi:antitoxin component YwqK of YwqJK toxin-antitoxin module
MMKSFFSKALAVLLFGAIQTVSNAQKVGDPYPSSFDLILKGVNDHNSGDYKKAIASYSQVVSGDSLYDLALYELALSAIADGQFQKALKSTEACLEFANDYHFDAMVLKGTALEKLERYDEAEAVFSQLEKEYNHYFRAFFEKGVFHLSKKDFPAALSSMEKSFSRNLIHPRTHAIVAVLAADSNQPAFAMMAFFYGALCASGDPEYALSLIGLLENLGAQTYEKSYEIEPGLLDLSNDLGALNELIESKAPLNKSYKLKVKADYTYVRFMQAICEKMPATIESNNPMLKWYQSFYKEVWDKGLFPGMVLAPLTSQTAPVIAQLVSKNKKKIEEFNKYLSAKVVKEAPEAEFTISGKTVKAPLFTSESAVIAAGTMNEEGIKTGKWYFFHDNGRLKSTGVFEKDKNSGRWEYYHKNGRIEAVNYFDSNGNLQGEKLNYSIHGIIAEKADYVQGKINGMYWTYHSNGNVSRKLEVKNDEIVGILEFYDVRGNLSDQYTMKGNQKNGPYKSFHGNGTLHIDATVVGDNLEGKYKEFYIEGQVYSEGEFKKGNKVGTWNFYHRNGAIMKTGSYVNGKEDGLWVEKSEEGQVTGEYSYKNGISDGSTKYYDRNGKIFADYTFKQGRITKSIFYNEDGSVLKENEYAKNGIVEIYSVLRVKASEGKIINDLREGEWTFYGPNGYVQTKANYTKGELNGPYTLYYPNGNVKAKYFYRDDNLEGYFVTYSPDAILESDGYYLEGRRHGYFKTYDYLGKESETTFYWKGEENGWNVDYHFGQVPYRRTLNTFGVAERTESFDEKGNLVGFSNVPGGTGLYQYFHPSGKVSFEVDMKNGEGETYVKEFDNEGKVVSEVPCKFGNRHGLFKSYYPTGTLKSEGEYVLGDKNGLWKEYDELGNLTRELTFRNGDLQGRYTTYYSNGKKQLERNYDDGERDGYAYIYAPDGSLIIRINYIGGVFYSYSYHDASKNFVKEKVVLDNGSVVAYYPNGKKSAEFTLKNGDYDGLFARYNTDGKLLMKSTYVNGHEEGLSQVYHPGGQLQSEENYVKGEFDGLVKNYSETGKLISQYTYTNGELNGAMVVNDKSGKPVVKGTYYYGLFSKN